MGVSSKQDRRAHLDGMDFWNMTKQELFDHMREQLDTIGADKVMAAAERQLEGAVRSQEYSHMHLIRGYDNEGLYVWNPGNGVSHWIDTEGAEIMLRNKFYSVDSDQNLITSASAAAQE